jgi:hypothetical protein
MQMQGVDDLATALAEGGAVVSGSAALAAVLGLIVGSAAKDLAAVSPRARARGWHEIDPVRVATRWAPYGGLLGVLSLVFRWTGLD